MKAIAKSSQGLSNPDIGELLRNNSAWAAIWPVRQLLALGFIEYKTDYFGEASRYFVTELGKQAVARIMGQPVPKTQAAQGKTE